MTNVSKIGLLLICAMFIGIAHAQDVNPADSTGLPGDHFSLEGAIELFKESDSPEDFEKRLNASDNKVNNLDLNEDGEVDYIRVVDNMDKDVHALVLQVPVSAAESQDVAVIEIEKTGKEDAILQIVGDENIFGESKIAEPFEEEGYESEPGKGPSADMETRKIVVNVFFWRPVRFIYAPGYRVWVSPYRWAYYPTWWRPWRPRPWRSFYISVRPFRRHCRIVTTHRVVRAHKVYAPRRTTSVVVHKKTTTRVAARKTPAKAGVSRTKSTTVVKTDKGVGVKRQTTTKVGATGKNKKGVATKKTTTTKAVGKNKKGQTVSGKRKSTTTKAVGKNKKGNTVAGKKKTTKTVKRKR